MAAKRYPWRIQGEVKPGETDPMMTVFMGQTRGDQIEHDVTDPVEVPLSKLVSTLDGDQLQAINEQQVASRVAAGAERTTPPPKTEEPAPKVPRRR